MENIDFWKNEYFKQLDVRLDVLEKKIDRLTDKVTYIYAFSSGFAIVAGFIINFIMK